MTVVAAAPEVFTMGEALIVMLASDALPLVQARQYERWVAGAESNVAVGLSRLGHSTTFCGRVGVDPFGDAVRRFLREEAVDTSALRSDPGGRTGVMMRDAPSGQAIGVIYHREGSAGSRLAPDDVPLDVVRSARCLHLSGITAMLSESADAAVLAAVRAAADAGRPVLVDPNLRLKLGDLERWRAVLQPILESTGTVLVGGEEMELLAEGAGVGWFLDRGAGLVVVKDGARGAWATDGTSTWRQEARRVVVVDAVGAGDAFNAGWISAQLRGLPVQESLVQANLVASCVVAVRGDTGGLPTAAARDHLLRGDADAVR